MYIFSIWEPPLNISFDEDEARALVSEAQVLTDRVTEVEKSFGSKPLQTIPLPKPLEDYTWVSFAKTVTYLHKYISNKGMVWIFVSYMSITHPHTHKHIYVEVDFRVFSTCVDCLLRPWLL